MSFREVTVIINLIIIPFGIFTNLATLFLLIRRQIRGPPQQNRQRDEGPPIYVIFASTMV